jgi:hypothetical protein
MPIHCSSKAFLTTSVFECTPTFWLRPADLDRGGLVGGGLPHHLHAFAGGEDGLQALPEHGVVIRQRQVHSYGHIQLFFRMNKVHASRSHGDRPRLSTSVPLVNHTTGIFVTKGACAMPQKVQERR